MSDKIVIIGNGFDLRHFLPTKYNHLITVLREIENLDFDTISEVNFENLFGKLFKEKDEWFYEKIKEYYETSEITFDIQDLKSIQKRVKTNNWFQYLKSVEDDKIETWIDFETEIERVLKQIVEFFDIYNKANEDGKLQYSSEGIFFIHTKQYKRVFKNKLQYNILNTFLLFQNLENRLTIVNKKYILEVDFELQYFKEKYFFDSIYNSLETFISVFNDYIEKIINLFYENFREDKKENFVKSKNNFLFDKVNKIYSFNYTNTFNRLYRYKDTIKEAVRNLPRENKFNQIDFLHGKSVENWNDNVEKLEIVLGVNDINPLLKNHKLFQFTKYFQKLHKNTDYLFLDDIVKTTKTNTSYYKIDFIFWGHSLDNSDKDYINDVFYIVNKNLECKIKIFYHSISGKADQLKNLLNIIDKDIIESMMKNDKLIFIESTPENLFEEL